jgi:uncharacterized damage-inducible protein DinB
MEVKQLVEETFEEIERDLERALEGLTSEELTWRPNAEANPIGFTFWHVSRAEDGWVNGFALQRSHVFSGNGWAERWSIPADASGFGFTAEQLAKFPTPPLAELWEYHGEVRQQTIDYLGGLGPQDFDYKPPADSPFRSGYTVGRMFGHLMSEIGQHVGHIWYLRGLQRGLNK